MAEQPTGGGDWPGERMAELRARRERRRRSVRRRRLFAAGALLIGGASIVAVLVGGGSGAAGHRRASGGNGYEAVTLEQVEAAWYHGGTLPPKPVVLSFDDGYRPQFTYALPELRRHGWAGVLNLKAEGSDLYASNVEAMIDAGWELAAHTIHHLDLTELDAAQLDKEVAGSRAILRREYGVPVADFCYPAGRFDEAAIAAVKAAGYVGATSEISGYATHARPYELARFEILGSEGVAGLTADLR